MKQVILLFALISLFNCDKALSVGNKNNLFIYWGYNRSMYTKSNIHFNSERFDITFYDVKAKDRPSKLGIVYLDPTRLSIPQYNIRLGYYISDRVSISIGSDHMKYVVNANQPVTMSGIIRTDRTTGYNGTYFHDSVKLSSDLLQFEHSDGLNLLSLETDYAQPLFQRKWLKVDALIGLGGIWVITRTDVKILNEGINNDFHLSGYALTSKAGFRIFMHHRFFVSVEGKGGYMSLNDIPIHNRAPERADQNFCFFEYYGAIGYKYPIQNISKRLGFRK